MTASSYAAIRGQVDSSANNAQRVEVNQRALIDKILSRYASPGAVYRELLQNSNDAEATESEIYFTTATPAATETPSSSNKSNNNNIVSEVVYRNNGMPFRPQDWERLQKIAEGNPDVKKIGAFGVGAYTMFSICEEPLVISGGTALAFVWKGDALWTKTVQQAETDKQKWTSFVLPSRDPYPLPSLVEFGQFLCANLTFTQCLATVKVYVNNVERLVISKSVVRPPSVVTPPKSSSWFKNDGAVTQTPQKLFSLQTKGILESIQRVQVILMDKNGAASSTARLDARYVSGTAATRIPADMVKRMERVTKKKPPKEVTVQLFLNAKENDGDADKKKESPAHKILQSFRPPMGGGRIFIGFRTSQTTGLAAHLAAPFIPTVEREAIDLQDATLRIFNCELLEFSGIVLRLTLEHSMNLIGQEWMENKAEREALERKLLQEEQKASPPVETQTSTVSESESGNGDDATAESESKSGSSSLFGFAKYMARGVKKSIVSVVKSVDNMVDDGSTELLNPRDPRPLSSEEKHAILLMRSFCPQQSTPDTLVGTALAQGFSRCMPNAAPLVLTRSGVMRGSEARIPHYGMEAFCQECVVRKVMYQNAQEYHDVLAMCPKLRVEDVTQALGEQVLEQEKVVRFLKWWTKYSRIEPRIVSRGPMVKHSIRFVPPEMGEVGEVQYLKDRLYYEDRKIMGEEGLPMPDTVLQKDIQEEVGLRTLGDNSLRNWFAPMPIVGWAEFISEHACMTAGQPEDEKLRVKVLALLSKEYTSRSMTERVLFSSFLQSILGEKRCIPFDSQEPTQFAAACPSDLYLDSAQLKAFEGIGMFHKVSQSLREAGVADSFLLALGVRQSVAIDFLFTNLDSLAWSQDPKPLIEYLRSATLTSQDMVKLKRTQYLPSENDVTRMFAPGELYLPNPDLRIFPFLRILQWPSDDEPSDRSANGKFLVKLGCKVYPPLLSLLEYISNKVQDDQIRMKCLDYVVKKLGSGGKYDSEYARLRSSQSLRGYRFLPCARRDVLVSDTQIRECRSPLECFSDAPCIVMGFPVVDPTSEQKNGHLLGTRFKCDQEPDPDALVRQLEHLVAAAKKKLEQSQGAENKKASKHVLKVFGEIFKYLSSRSTEFNDRLLKSIKAQSFIPCEVNGALQWYKPTEIYFKSPENSEDSLTETLFHVIDFSPFLAAAGVRSEANTHDLFRLMLTSPEEVLRILGDEAKYRTLLRRIASNPPFRRISPAIRNAPFLIAYKIEEGKDGQEEKRTYLLAKAEDIFVVDNSYYGRMFNVIRAPHESDLEDFYVSLGSSYISKKVSTTFEVLGRQLSSTSLTVQLGKRIEERRPLLVSPSVTSRPLISNASSVLDAKNIQIFEVDSLKAVYTLGKSIRNQRVTCCAKPVNGRKNGLFVTEDFDWFDVGNAIGGLILQRCQLEDAFFIGSLLDAPVEQLRARGFPVDRILRPPEPAPEPPKKPPTTAPPVPVAASQGTSRLPQPPTSSGKSPSSSGKGGDEGFETIIQQMFPDCQEEYIRSRLGPKPTLDTVRELADEMSSGNYPKKQGASAMPPDTDAASVASAATASTQSTSTESKAKKPSSSWADNQMMNEGKRRLGSRLGRALSSKRGSAAAAAAMQAAASGMPQTARTGGKNPVKVPPREGNDGRPVAPEVDSSSQQNMEQMLKHSVDNSTKVSSKGVNSAETVLTHVPEGLDRGSDGCEIIPGHALKPFSGQYRTGKTHNGIRVFSARHHPESETFLQEHFHAVDSFADVLQNLCRVYELNLASVAIFHDPSGGTIAFNASRSLYFNVRFFFALHYSHLTTNPADCYSYWFTTCAHELAHHLVSAHNKEHGFYTESYVTLYLPKLATLLQQLPSANGS